MVHLALSCQGKGDGGEERERVRTSGYLSPEGPTSSQDTLRGTCFGTSLLKSDGEVPPRMGKDDESNQGKTWRRDLSPTGDSWGHPVSPPPTPTALPQPRSTVGCTGAFRMRGQPSAWVAPAGLISRGSAPSSAPPPGNAPRGCHLSQPPWQTAVPH